MVALHRVIVIHWPDGGVGDYLSVKLLRRLVRGGWRRDAARIVFVGHAFCDERAARFARKLLIVRTKLTGCHLGLCADRERRRAGQQRDQQSGNEGISMHRGNSYYDTLYLNIDPRCRGTILRTSTTDAGLAGYDVVFEWSTAIPHMPSPPPVSTILAGITPGLTGTADLVVGPEHTAPFVGSGRIAVLATPVMINVIEAAALAAAEHLLPAGHQSLGIHLDVSHIAATPVGLRVTATAEVLRVEGRTITFRVEARDDVETIGEGTHQRVVVSVARFDERVQRKLRGEK